MIKSGDLHKVWAAPDNSRLTSKQFSFRLPLHVAAKLSALEEMYPSRTRTEIVCDLLAAALDEVAQTFPMVKGQGMGSCDPDTGEKLFEDIGPEREFRKLSNKYYKELEKELGNKAAPALYPEGGTWEVESDFPKK